LRRGIIPNPALLPLLSGSRGAGSREQGREDKGGKFLRGFMRRVWYN